MSCLSIHTCLHKYQNKGDKTHDLTSNQFYHKEPLSELRIKFFLILFWNPLQALGNISLRLFHIATGSWLERGREVARYTLNDRILSLPCIVKYQLIELAKEITKLLLFVIFGVALREIIALFGLLFPLDGRVHYAKIEKTLFSYPKHPLTTKANLLECFSFSAPCMQPYDPIFKQFLHRCNPFVFNPEMLSVRISLLRTKILLAQQSYLSEESHETFKQLTEAIVQHHKKITQNHQKPSSALTQLTNSAISALDDNFKKWQSNQEPSLETFFSSVQEALNQLNSQI